MEYVSMEQHNEFVKRIDSDISEMKSDIRDIKNLSLSVERISISVEAMQKELEVQSLALKAIQAVPGENWKKITYEVIKYFIILLLGIACVKIGATI